MKARRKMVYQQKVMTRDRVPQKQTIPEGNPTTCWTIYLLKLMRLLPCWKIASVGTIFSMIHSINGRGKITWCLRLRSLSNSFFHKKTLLFRCQIFIAITKRRIENLILNCAVCSSSSREAISNKKNMPTQKTKISSDKHMRNNI